MFRKPMKMRDLEFLGVPSYIVDIWEKNYSRYLLAIQEEAVRYYGVLDYNGSDGIATLSSKVRNDRKGMGSRFHGNAIYGGGNDTEERGEEI